MHKSDPKALADYPDKRSVILLDRTDFYTWLEDTSAQAKKLMTLASIEVFEAEPLNPQARKSTK